MEFDEGNSAMSDELMHYGMPRRSGRYPWGSGENPYQSGGNFYIEAKKLREQGISETDLAKLYGMTTTEFRKQYSLGKTEHKANMRAANQALIDEGLNRSERAKRLGVNESTIRSWENEASIKKENMTAATVDVLKKNVDEKKYIDVGEGVASGLGITDNRLNTAVQSMVNDGYVVHDIKVQQANNPGKYTTVHVLCEPGTTVKDLYANEDKIGLVNEHFDDKHGLTSRGIKPPKSISSDKVQVVYGEDGGETKDGLIELRRGAKGLDMGNANYAQVRIAVDDSHYLKGVAVYSDDLPKGVDIRFNTNKSNTGNKLDAMKSLKTKEDGSIDWDNPFGSTINRQNTIDGKPNSELGYLNICNEQGTWQKWSKTLSSQFLSKQPVKLAKEQLTIAKQQYENDLKDIMSLTNPVVKRHELNEFADKCDTAAVHLKAAAMPGQTNSLILPVNSMKPTEVYAPNYPNGTEVVLVRHPHGGTFELPSLRVNNRNKEAKQLIGASNDAIGIHHKVAAQLSGADFDGDTVIVIPNNSHKIKTRSPLEGLKDFDPKIYKFADPEGADKSRIIKSDTKQTEMGKASNLITDMTLRNAPEKDIVKAVKYSMVVIDSEKHALDYKQAKRDYEIESLKRKYQHSISDDGKEKYGGASTLISRAKSEVRIPERRLRVDVDKTTGEKIYYPTNRTYVDKKGKVIAATTKTTRMAEAKDAFDLVSTANNGTGTLMERVYAQHANSMKSMANQARLAAVNTVTPPKNPAAAKEYAPQVESLKVKLAAAKAWSPKERSAQLYADHVYKMKRLEDPNMTSDTKKKIRTQALETGRARVRGDQQKPVVEFTKKEWEAVQAGAIAPTTLTQLLRYADSDKVRELAMPRASTALPPSKLAIAKSRLNANYSYKEVAKMLGVSVSTLQRAVNQS